MVRRNKTELRGRGPGADHGRSDRHDPPGSANPWLAASGGAVDESERESPAPIPPVTAGGSLAPQPGMVPAPREAALPRVTLAPGAAARVWWVGAHGGAGESTLARLLAGSRASGHAWPVTVPDTRETRPPVVLVARTHASGLRAAQAAATEWAAGLVPVRLLGLVLIADAPGRTPRALRDLAQLVAGGVPTVWRLPWHEPWRLGRADRRQLGAARRPRAGRGGRRARPACRARRTRPSTSRPGHAAPGRRRTTSEGSSPCLTTSPSRR